MDYARIEAAAAAAGLIARGGFHPEAADGVPACADGRPARTLVLLGNAGPGMWRAFAAAREDGPHPLNAWTRRVVTRIAADLGASPLFPFDGPPFLPFLGWAQRGEPVAPSPLGMLIHPDYGLWHAYRGALAFAQPVALPAPDTRPSPCASCTARPCLDACPVGAFAARGDRPAAYDVAACAGHLRGSDTAGCMDAGCAARRACPAGREFVYEPGQARFHMARFLAARDG